MLKKSTMIKIAAAVLAVCIIMAIVKMKSKKKTIMVTALPMYDPAGYVEDDDFETSQTTLAPVKENFGDWTADDAGDYDDDDETEGFTEFSDVNFKSDLLE